MRSHLWLLTMALLAGCSAVLDIKDKEYQPAAGAGGAAGQGAGQGGGGGLSGQGGAGQGGAGMGGAGQAGAGGAGMGGDAGMAGADQAGAAGMPAVGVRPPLRPAQPSDPANTARSVAFAVRKFHFGQNDPTTGKPMTLAWRTIGFDIDGVNTTMNLAKTPKPGTCLKATGASVGTLIDGDEGRDNSFASNLFPLFNGLTQGTVESMFNQGIEAGTSPTLVILLSLLHDGADDPIVPSSYFFSVVSNPVQPPAWDGSDDLLIDSQSVSNSSVGFPKVSFVNGYVSGNTYVSGDFNDTSSSPSLFIPLGKIGFVGLSFVSATVVIEMDAARQKATRATIVGALEPQKLEEFFKKLAITQLGCEKAQSFFPLFPDFYSVTDLRSGQPDFLDPTSTLDCDLVSFAIGMDLEPIQMPSHVAQGPVVDNTCAAGMGGSSGAAGGM